MEVLKIRLWTKHPHYHHGTKVYFAVVVCSVLLIGFCGVAVAAEQKQGGNSSADNNSENPIPQVRYRSRPVAAFHSGPKPANSNSTGNSSSSENDGPEGNSGVPFIAVHDLTSQTFEKLQENWKKVEVFLRNLQRSRSQAAESSPTNGVGVPSSSGVDRDSPATARRPPYNNVYTFKYHPVILEGEGSSSASDPVGGSARRTPPNSFNGNGINFNPFPYDPKGEGSQNVDMERHTVATIYTIGICLTIMAIGSVMFILINKCDGTAGSSYIRTNAPSAGAGGRNARNGRPSASNNNNARSRNGRSGRTGNGNAQVASSNSANAHTSATAESSAKISIDLPPSYDSLFPEGGPKLQEINDQATTNAATGTIPEEIHDSNNMNLNDNNSQLENSRPPGGTTSTSTIT